MSFTFTCSFCGAHLQCEDYLTGQTCNCPNCGKEILLIKKTEGIQVVKETSSKSFLGFLLWGLFFSNIGIHEFYLGRTGLGMAHILVTILFLAGGLEGMVVNTIIQSIWFIIEIFVIETDSEGRLLK